MRSDFESEEGEVNLSLNDCDQAEDNVNHYNRDNISADQPQRPAPSCGIPALVRRGMVLTSPDIYHFSRSEDNEIESDGKVVVCHHGGVPETDSDYRTQEEDPPSSVTFTSKISVHEAEEEAVSQRPPEEGFGEASPGFGGPENHGVGEDHCNRQGKQGKSNSAEFPDQAVLEKKK